MINQKTEIVLGDKDLIITNYVNTKERTAALLFAAGIIDTLKERQSLEGTFVKSIEDVTHQARIVFKSLEDIENLIGMLKELKEDYESLTEQSPTHQVKRLKNFFKEIGAKRVFNGDAFDDYEYRIKKGVKLSFRIYKLIPSIEIREMTPKTGFQNFIGVLQKLEVNLPLFKDYLITYSISGRQNLINLIKKTNGTAGI